MTIGEIYDPVMKIQSQEEADAKLKELIARLMVENSALSFEDANEMAVSNIIYYSGYMGGETRKRMQKLFGDKTNTNLFKVQRDALKKEVYARTN